MSISANQFNQRVLSKAEMNIPNENIRHSQPHLTVQKERTVDNTVRCSFTLKVVTNMNLILDQNY